MRSQSPEEKAKEKQKKRDTHGRSVGDVAVAWGMFPVHVENIGWVTGLRGTGSDPEPSPQRSVLVEEMQRRGVANPNTLLASHNASMVLVRAVIRPGIQKGDHFDIEVRVPGRSETTSLRGGYLLETRLNEMAILNDGMVHNGRDRAVGQGPILVDPTADQKKDKDRVLLTKGRILGGGTYTDRSRALGLVMKPEHKDAVVSARVALAVNKRFHSYEKGLQVGVAKAHNDEYVELAVHPRYKENLERYMEVVRSVSIQESSAEAMKRMADLDKDLLKPETAAKAAVQLEAIGTTGIDTLLKGLKSPDHEVQFYSAEALAYMGRREAAEPLGQAARNEPAFRMLALTALASLDDPSSAEQLRNLLNVPSAETRYGAFRALWTMDPNDPMIHGQQLGGQFSYHVLDTPGSPMIHVTRNRRAEIVLFGRQQQFTTPLAINAGNQIMVTSISDDEISVSKFTTHDADEKRTVSTHVDDVIRAIVELGGSYPDVVQALHEAKAAGALSSRFEVDTLPEAGIPYERVAKGSGDDKTFHPNSGESSEQNKSSDGKDAPKTTGSDASGTDKAAADKSDSDKNPQSVGAFFDRMVGRTSD
jgi:flagellar basal body P-ring protein FlgI